MRVCVLARLEMLVLLGSTVARQRTSVGTPCSPISSSTQVFFFVARRSERVATTHVVTGTNFILEAGLEPAISSLGGRRLIH